MFVTAIKVMGDSGKEYTVSITPENKAACNCPNYVFNKGVCKHMAFVSLTVKRS